MGVALLAWGRFFGPHGERVTVPAPVDGRGAPWLLDFLTSHVRALAQCRLHRDPAAADVEGARRSGAGL